MRTHATLGTMGLVFVAVVALVGLTALIALGIDTDPSRGGAVDPQDAYKARHAADVVAELRARDVSHLTPAQRANRERNLALLAAYGEAGRFAQNEDFPGEAIPHLIDRHGTRCALANLIDLSGDRQLLLRLADQNNIAFVPELRHDRELGGWLEAQGLSLDEAAYIQAPGFVDPTGPSPPAPDLGEPDPPDPAPPLPGDPDPLPPGEPSGPTPQPGEDPDQPGGEPTTPRPTTTAPTTPTPTAPAPRTPAPGSPTPKMGGENGRGRRPRAAASRSDWETWWQLNRHAYLNLRARYHDGAVVTGASRRTRIHRPSETEIDAVVMPLLSRMGRDPDCPVRPTALMAWARAARPQHAPAVLEAVRTYLRDESNYYRVMMIMALGVVGHPDAVTMLKAILADTKEGRRILARRGAIAERSRAFAAIALGQAGDTSAVADLRAILKNNKKRLVDLKAACVMSLGTLARDCGPEERRRVGSYLVRQLRASKWSDEVLAVIPTALAAAGDEARTVETAGPMLRRFRKPHMVRQSSALAIGSVGAKATPRLVDILVATARRDPNDTARRFGIVALGELAAANPGDPESGEADPTHTAIGTKLMQYYKGAFAGRSVQKTDLPWLCLSAALFTRGHPDHAAWVAQQLRPVARRASAKDHQAAAIVALGLMNDRGALPMLSKLYEGTRHKLVKGYLVETLGVLGDSPQRDALL